MSGMTVDFRWECEYACLKCQKLCKYVSVCCEMYVVRCTYLYIWQRSSCNSFFASNSFRLGEGRGWCGFFGNSQFINTPDLICARIILCLQLNNAKKWVSPQQPFFVVLFSVCAAFNATKKRKDDSRNDSRVHLASNLTKEQSTSHKPITDMIYVKRFA